MPYRVDRGVQHAWIKFTNIARPEVFCFSCILPHWDSRMGRGVCLMIRNVDFLLPLIRTNGRMKGGVIE